MCVESLVPYPDLHHIRASGVKVKKFIEALVNGPLRIKKRKIKQSNFPIPKPRDESQDLENFPQFQVFKISIRKRLEIFMTSLSFLAYLPPLPSAREERQVSGGVRPAIRTNPPVKG